MESAEIVVYAGVALFGMSPEADMATLQWAYKHLHLSEEYKLRIIHVSELKQLNNNADLPRESPDSRYEHLRLEKNFKGKYPDYSKKYFQYLQDNMQEHGVHEYICGVTYEGESVEAALQYAINKEEGMDTPVLAWSVADDRKGPLINRLESERCSIVLAKVDPRKLTSAMPSTKGSAATTAATSSSSMAAALTNQLSNDVTHSIPSNANTQCPVGRATRTATVAARHTTTTEAGSSSPPSIPPAGPANTASKKKSKSRSNRRPN